jgi:2-polyprenyl-6-methoxyphenol hydroxylase-like FAD-dependent oxidoreductase
MDAEVLVVGAGPVGLMLAAELALAGCRPLVVERLSRPSTERKARGVGPLAAEALRRRGLAGRLAGFHERGLADFRADHGSDRAHFAWIHKIEMVRPDEPTRTPRFVWQPDLEGVLGRWVAELDVPVLREHEVTGLEQGPDGVTATLRTPAGDRRIEARYLVGCDGGRSTVRPLAGYGFPGTAPYMVMRAGRVELADPDVLPPPGRRETGQLMHGGGRLGTAEFGAFPEDRRAPLTVEELTASVRRVSGADVTVTALREPLRVLDHARQAATYRIGRVLLAGDAAHVHSPNGGQGLNLGLMDAVNLGWKLAAAARGTAPDGLLDSYTAERHPVASAVLHNTRAQSALLTPGPHHDALRDIVAELMDLPAVNAHFAEMMSGLHGRYPMPGPGGGTRNGTENGTDAHPLLGQHLPDLAVHPLDTGPSGPDAATGRPAPGDATTLYALATGARPLLVHTDPAVAEAAAGWSGRVRMVAATHLGQSDLADLLVRPDGVLAWARRPGEPVDGEGLRRALSHWFGDPI